MSKNQESNHKSFYAILGKIGDILLWPVLIISLFSSFFMLVQKKQNKITSIFGYSFVNVLSGSMVDEGFKIGDTVITHRCDERNVELGDIIAFYYTSSTKSPSASDMHLVVEYKNYDYKEIVKEYKKYARTIKKYVCDTTILIHKLIKENKKIICEGAQATLLDIDHGSYPYVTSSNPTIGGILTGSGLNPHNIGEVYGVMKAYSSRVGEGPYVTEQKNEIGDMIRELGHEYGATTKRPRRCGYLDLVALRYAVLINGITALCMNHLDTIGKLAKIKLCVAYERDGKITEDFTTNEKELLESTPVYEEFVGNYGDISNIRRKEDLPPQAKEYIKRIEEYVGVPIKFIGVGAGREEIIIE